MGQLKEGTDTKEGIGIVVHSNGDIYEGWWKDDKIEGKGPAQFAFELYQLFFLIII